jgi:tellurite resistance protein TehA-like permease
MLLAAALANGVFAAGRVLAVVFLAVTIATGGWLTGQWMTGGIEPDSVHPGYFLPTAAGGLIGANAAAQVHLHALAVASFGIGVICWIMLGSVIMYRLFTRPALPNALVPTMAIELGIPAVAGLAYFAVAGRTVSFVACAIGGYAVLMALVQVRLVPVYRRLSFTPGAWSFAFAYAAAAADALVWLAIKKPPASSGYAIAVIALLTALCLVDRLPHAGPRRPRPALSRPVTRGQMPEIPAPVPPISRDHQTLGWTAGGRWTAVCRQAARPTAEQEDCDAVVSRLHQCRGAGPQADSRGRSG